MTVTAVINVLLNVKYVIDSYVAIRIANAGRQDAENATNTVYVMTAVTNAQGNGCAKIAVNMTNTFFLFF